MTDNETRSGFIAKILEDPASDEPRLIYADWLEEQGDPRAEFIRAQCQAARLDPTDPKLWDLEQRAADLLAAHQDQWLADFPNKVSNCEFRRGFCEAIAVKADRFPAIAAKVMSNEPVVELTLTHLTTKSGKRAAAIANQPEMQHIRTLEMAGLKVTEAELKTLFASEYLTALENVGAQLAPGTPVGQFVVQSDRLRACLKSLTLVEQDFSRRRAIVLSGEWSELQHLTLRGRMPPQAVRAPLLRNLTISPRGSCLSEFFNAIDSPELESLQLEGSPTLTEQSVNALIATEWLPSLRALRLISGVDESFSKLFGPNRLSNLESLEAALPDTTNSLTCITALESQPLKKLILTGSTGNHRIFVELLAKLQGLLEFSFTDDDNSTFGGFVNSRSRNSIRRLTLRQMPFVALSQLLDETWPELHTLDVSSCKATDEEFASLVKPNTLPNLRSLNVWRSGLGPKTLAALADSGLEDLRRLNFTVNSADVESITQLLDIHPRLVIDVSSSTGLKHHPALNEYCERIFWH